MTQVFVSYKREDELRVARLVRALEGTGLTVWWDRGLPVGDNWRYRIEAALQAARCVIVVWTRESVGPAGDFVRDEAGQAKRRGTLVPVLMEPVDIPLGFGEVQTIDLSGWKGHPKDPIFEDLVAAVRAKVEGRPVPPTKAPARRLMRRLAYGGFVSAIVTSGVVLASNPFRMQDRLCGAVWPQPQLSDVCGALGIGNRPARVERVAWEKRKRGNCGDLRSHIERFPDGLYRDEAARLLTARRTTQTDVWAPAQRRLVLVVGEESAPSATESDARTAALRRGQVTADRLCKGFAASTLYRFGKAAPTPQTWLCSRMSGGVSCGFEGEVVCDLEQRSVIESERCGV
jgi:hypothetical protein